MCLAGGDRHGNLPLDALDNVDQVIDLHVVAQNCLVTNHDRIDVAVALGERDRLIDFTVIARDIFFDRFDDHAFAFQPTDCFSDLCLMAVDFKRH